MEMEYYLDAVSPLSQDQQITLFVPTNRAIQDIPVTQREKLAGRLLSEVSWEELQPLIIHFEYCLTFWPFSGRLLSEVS